MRKFTILTIVAIVYILAPPWVHAQAPREIAGFILGSKIDSCQEHLQMTTMMPIRYQPYLREVQIKSMGGFKTGLITYDNCAQPGRIVRIKMKYADPSKAFYDELLKRYKARFGRNPEWRGDPFHITQAWKWSFIDDQVGRISLTLQHNLKDRDEKRGNSVKLTLYNALEEAKDCFASQKNRTEAPPKKPVSASDWQRLIPQ